MESSVTYQDYAFYIIRKDSNNKHSIAACPFVVTPGNNKIIFQMLRDIDFSLIVSGNDIVKFEVYYFKHCNNRDNKLKILEHVTEDKFIDEVRLFYSFELNILDYINDTYINYDFEGNEFRITKIEYEQNYYLSNPSMIINREYLDDKLNI